MFSVILITAKLNDSTNALVSYPKYQRKDHRYSKTRKFREFSSELYLLK